MDVTIKSRINVDKTSITKIVEKIELEQNSKNIQ